MTTKRLPGILFLTIFVISLTASVLVSISNAYSIKKESATDCSSVTEIPQTECEALIHIYNEMGGENWHNNTGWLDTNTPCSWYGVTCYSTKDNVYGLDLYSNNLTGTLPLSFSSLIELRHLRFDNNNISGPFPLVLINMPELDHIFLNSNNLTGTIPAEIGTMPSLRLLDLKFNDLEGEIPTGILDLQDMYWLDLGRNNLTGTIPAGISQLPKLRHIELEYNNITGTFPTEILSMSQMTSLNLSGNPISGPLYPEIGNLTELVSLELNGMNLYGQIPPEFGNLTKLFRLSLGGQGITGTLPPELGNLTELTELRIWQSQITGTIPPEITSLPLLRQFWVWGTQLSGPIPAHIGNLGNVQDISFINNNFSGNIPPEIGNLTKLTQLTLANSEISGEIPPEFSNLSNLQTLYLAGNQLAGTIPLSLTQLTNLRVLWLNDNQYTGPIPSHLYSVTNLTNLNLANNQFTGELSTEIDNLVNLNTLDLRNNLFSGSIPSELGNLAALRRLYINDNLSLNGPLPLELVNLDLDTFYFDNTSLCEPNDAGFEFWLLSIPDHQRMNFSCDLTTLSISGQIKDSYGNPVPDVVVWAGFPLNAVSDEMGNYRFTGLFTGTYSIRPAKDFYSFDPTYIEVTVPPNKSQIDFTVNYDKDLELAKKFAPYMYFHRDELYRPISITVPLQYGNLWQNNDTPLSLSGPTLQDLMKDFWNKENSYIDFLGSGRSGMDNAYIKDILPKLTVSNDLNPYAYSRVFHDEIREEIAIQYWFFYYSNPWVNFHEGDWEMVQVVLDKNETPLYVAATHHLVHSKRLWTDVDKFIGTWGETHPKIYVALGGHGNYFKPFTYWQGEGLQGVSRFLPFPLSLIDIPGGLDETTPPTDPTDGTLANIELFPGVAEPCDGNSSDPWPCFQGHWGAYPEMEFPGPGNVINHRWGDPIGWSEGLYGDIPLPGFETLSIPGWDIGWDELGFHNMVIKFRASVDVPGDIHVYDLDTLDHVGWNSNQLDEDEDIKGSEYIDNPNTNKRTIILHETLPTEVSVNPYPYDSLRYKVVFWIRYDNLNQQNLASLDSSTASISFPDIISGQFISATYYLSNTWEASSTGTVTVTHGSDLAMSIDIDGDGNEDQIILPDSLEEIPFDYLGPDRIQDLQVELVNHDSVTLSWTASGDDGGIGIAHEYDLRYSTEPITDSNWVNSIRATDVLTPSIAGVREIVNINNLEGGNYYFAIKVKDEVNQISILSNVVEADIPYKVFLPSVIRTH